MFNITTFILCVIILSLCVYLFDLQPSVILKRVLGVLLIAGLILWFVYGYGSGISFKHR